MLGLFNQEFTILVSAWKIDCSDDHIHLQMILALESFPTSTTNIFSFITMCKFMFCKSTGWTKCFSTLFTLNFWFASSRRWLGLSLQFCLHPSFAIAILCHSNWSWTATFTFNSWGICQSLFLQAWCWRHNRGMMHRACVRLGSICGIQNMKITSSVSPHCMHHSDVLVAPHVRRTNNIPWLCMRLVTYIHRKNIKWIQHVHYLNKGQSQTRSFTGN